MLHRLKLAAVLILTLASAGQLVFHNHSLIPERTALACSICAFSADKASAGEPVLAVPLTVVFVLVAAEVVTPLAATPLTLSPRAPPAPRA